MRTSLVRLAGAAILGALAASPALAQVAAAPAGVKSMQVTPYAGYMVFGNMVDGPLGTSLRSSAGPLYGAQVGMTLTPGLSLIGNVAYASSDLSLGVPILGGVDVGTSKALIADAGLQLDLPAPRTTGLAIMPFLQAGVGGIRYDISVADIVNPRTQSLAGNIGIGADMKLGESVALSFLAKDYIAKFDMREAVGFEAGEVKTSHNWAITAGLKLAF